MRPTEELLNLIRVRTMIDAGWFSFGAPFGIHVPGGAGSIGMVHGADCVLRQADRSPIRLADGDIFAIIPEAEFILSNTLGTPPMEIGEFGVETMNWPQPEVPKLGGDGPITRIMGSRFMLEDMPANVRALLPPRIHLSRITDAGGQRSLYYTASALMAELEHFRPAQPAAVPRLIEALLVLLIRDAVERRPPAEQALLQSITDRYVISALQQLDHLDIADWSVGSMAERVGLSLTSFMKRFVGQLGETPSAYLTRRRMAVARILLHDSDLAVGEIAIRAGYDSGSAFCRAFKRTHAMGPGEYRAFIRRPLEEDSAHQ